MKKISIIIPAHNEEKRIGATLQEYNRYFANLRAQGVINFELVVVLNGCTDNTLAIVEQAHKAESAVRIINLTAAGKGLALIAGFKDAVTRTDNDLIGFVDADMATRPEYFYDLVTYIDGYDGAIASRYMPGAHAYPPRPWIKRVGRTYIYNGLVRMLFGLNYYDLQCGAKLFKRAVMEKIVPELTIAQWAFDVELLYLCKKHGFKIKEVPTTWYDQADSKLKIIGGGLPMITALFKLRFKH